MLYHKSPWDREDFIEPGVNKCTRHNNPIQPTVKTLLSVFEKKTLTLIHRSSPSPPTAFAIKVHLM